MLTFGGVAFWRWQSSGSLFFALTCLRDVAACWFLLTRVPSRVKSLPRSVELISYVSAGMPFAYLNSVVAYDSSFTTSANVLAIVGFTLSTVALFELGRAFGVAPANRAVIRTGVYKIFRHPMYYGYAVAEAGQVLINPMNIIVLVGSLSLYVYRARLENRALVSFPT